MDKLLINLRQDQEFLNLLYKEIKCPYSINGQLVTCNTMEVFQIVELGHREFCLEMSDQGSRLRRDHGVILLCGQQQTEVTVL